MLPWRCRAWGWDSRSAGREHLVEMKCEEQAVGTPVPLSPTSAIPRQMKALEAQQGAGRLDLFPPGLSASTAWSSVCLEEAARPRGPAMLSCHTHLRDCSLLSPPCGIRLPPPHQPCCDAGERTLTLPAFLLVFPFYLVPESLVMEGFVTGVKTSHTQKYGALFPGTALNWLQGPPRLFTVGVRKGRAPGKRTQVQQIKEVQSG